MWGELGVLADPDGETFRRPVSDNSGQQEEEYIEPVVEHQIPQRTQLADLICPRITDITPHNAVKRRIQVAKLMLALCKCREVPARYRLRVGIPPPSIFKEESPELGPLDPIFPLECSKKQCIFCIGDEWLEPDENEPERLPLLSSSSLEAAEENLNGKDKELFLNFIKSMLQWEPEKRKTARELLNDPWLTRSQV
mgnify:CR=1 FL=1